MGAWAHGADRLACLCGADDCPAGENPPSTGVVVYVIASADTITTPPPTPNTELITPIATPTFAGGNSSRMIPNASGKIAAPAPCSAP